MAETPQSGSEMIRVILTRAATDAALRAQLVAGGAAALRKLGVDVPDGVTIRFVEDSVTVRHLVIPSPDGAELTEADLDKVAGGARDQLQQMGGRPSMQQQMGEAVARPDQLGRGPSFGGIG